MKIDLTVIHKLGLTPDQLLFLVCKKNDKEPKLINLTKEKRSLETDGFIDVETGELTQKGIDIIIKASYVGRSQKEQAQELKPEEICYVSKYREMFPAGKLPKRPPFRSSEKELAVRFKWFFTKYPEYRDWNLILQATAMVIDETRLELIYLPSSENFIYKTEPTKHVRSRLAEYCQSIQENANQFIIEHQGNQMTFGIPGLD